MTEIVPYYSLVMRTPNGQASSPVPAAGDVSIWLVQSITQAAKRQMTISSPSTDLEHAEIPDREVVISELDGALLSSSAIVI